jgi:hypothetical protein
MSIKHWYDFDNFVVSQFWAMLCQRMLWHLRNILYIKTMKNFLKDKMRQCFKNTWFKSLVLRIWWRFKKSQYKLQAQTLLTSCEISTPYAVVVGILLSNHSKYYTLMSEWVSDNTDCCSTQLWNNSPRIYRV